MITRDDGAKQLAYAGRPLYRFAGDAAVGDAKSQGLANNTWLVAAATSPAALGTPAAGTATGTPRTAGATPTPELGY